jgi:hypothetical protein
MTTSNQTLEQRITTMLHIANWHLERAAAAETEVNDRDYRYHQQAARNAYRAIDAMKSEQSMTNTADV